MDRQLDAVMVPGLSSLYGFFQRRMGEIGVPGAVFLIPALVMLLFAAAAALMHAGLSDPVAYLITGVGAAVISAGLIAIGLNRLSGDALKPTVTLDQVQRDKVAAKEIMR